MDSLNNRIAKANTLLKPYAVPHQGILGRERHEEPDATRFLFQRDRDRIIHTTAFRRLKGKTQVFVTGDGDHYRTRLTHTLEVAQISRDIARTLGLNEDLAECIALAHDLGHPPFGHGGEHAIDSWMKTYGQSFEHNLQSHRIVTLLERRSPLHTGLNLNLEILQGLLKHATPHDRPGSHDLPEGAGHTLEAQVVNMADEIAYTCHDCEDGLRKKLFAIDRCEGTALGARAKKDAGQKGVSLGSAMVNILVTDLYEETERRLQALSPASIRDILDAASPLVGCSDGMRRELDEMSGMLWQSMYMHPQVAEKIEEGQKLVIELCESMQLSPPEKVLALMTKTGSPLVEAIKDYVAGMTDSFARETWMRLRGAAGGAQ